MVVSSRSSGSVCVCVCVCVCVACVRANVGVRVWMHDVMCGVEACVRSCGCMMCEYVACTGPG